MMGHNYWPRQLVDHVKTAGLTVESCEFILPVLEVYLWLPKNFRETYQAHIRFFDRTPGLRRFGVSTMLSPAAANSRYRGAARLLVRAIYAITRLFSSMIEFQSP